MGQVVNDPEVIIAHLDKVDKELRELRSLFSNGFTSKTIPVEGNTDLTNAQQILKANDKPITACNDVVDGLKGLKVRGIVTQYIEREVNTKRGPIKILDVNLDDKTAVMRITFWNPSKVPPLTIGEEVTIEGLMGKPPYNGSPQASGGDYVKITKK